MWTCVRGVCTWLAGGGVPDLSCADAVRGSPCAARAETIWLATAAAALNGTWLALAASRRLSAARVRGRGEGARAASARRGECCSPLARGTARPHQRRQQR